ncbi:FAD/NAD(P)-binding protein [Nocardia huaxiensis]|uniref:FAD/NAD(P)-binding protein n=1 Tax=Nocardia huaxiensis TaxID=2755382 RepID=UPI001E47A0C9|nr:FAD/NAD(P)-binding protein [Nocardia huaxiensis]UFS96718.1 FAD/NAD(P)-binding protein [Nocardia huaxiensis]
MHIGIIGGGAAAVGLLDALAGATREQNSGGNAGRITVFDGSAAMWRGRPYQVDAEAVRVNAPPRIMSVRAGDPTHYQEWLRGRDGVDRYLDDGLGQPLLPRGQYGEYLADTARAAIATLRHAGWRVSVVNARVTGYSRDRGAFRRADRDTAAEPAVLPAADSGTVPTAGATLHTDDGGRVETLRAALLTEDGGVVAVDRAVLCVGSGRPRDHYGLSGAPGYRNEPYPLAETLREVPADAHVAVIGSGLTAVDIAAALDARGHVGRISFLSRSGTLPFVQQRPVRLEPRHLTAAAVAGIAAERGELTFADLVSLMRAELADLGDDFESFANEILGANAEDPVERLRRQLAAVDAPHRGLRLLAMVIRVAGPVAWPLLRERDQAMLRTRHFRVVNGLSSPMVPHNAKILVRLLDSGQLRLRSGLRKIEARAGGGFTVSDEAEWTADVVLNAVNPPAYTTPQDTAPLVSALLEAGAAELHPAGGLRVDPATRRLLVGGRADATWHVLGNLAADSMFIATNPPGLAQAAARLAPILLER